MNLWKRSANFLWVAFKLLWRRKKLLLLPAASTMLIFGVTAVFYHRDSFSISLGGSVYDSVYAVVGVDELRAWVPSSPGFELGLGILLSLLISFTVLLFNTAFIHSILASLNGQTISVRRGWSQALAKLPQISAWALISALMLWSLGRMMTRGPQVAPEVRLGVIVCWLGSVAWNLATYFVIPILIFEKIRLTRCFKRSLQLLSATWKEQTVFRFVFIPLIAAAFFTVMAFLPVLPYPFWNLSPYHELAGSVLSGLWFTVAGGVEAAFCAILYSYAITGMSPGELLSFPVGSGLEDER